MGFDSPKATRSARAEGLATTLNKLQPFFYYNQLPKMTTQATSAKQQKFLKTSFYRLVDAPKTIKNCEDLMSQYQNQYNANKPKKLHRRVISASLKDAVWAIVRTLPATMEDMKKNQPKVYKECVETGKFFIFTTRSTLASKMLSQYKDKNEDLKLSGQQINNIIKKLIAVGILTEKRNYTNVGADNPTPEDYNPKGRGKIQLWVNPEVLEFNMSWQEIQAEMQSKGNAQSDPQNGANIESFAQYVSDTVFKEDHVQHEYPNGSVDNAVSPSGDASLSENKAGTVQGLQDFNQTSKNKGRNFLKFSPTLENMDYFAQWLWEQTRTNLYDGRQFNAYQEQQAIQLIKTQLETCAVWVQLYRSAQINRYTESERFQAYSEKMQGYKLKAFGKHLPAIERSAVEILSRAIQKQRHHAIKNEYLQNMVSPTRFLASAGFDKAIGYAQKDFEKIHKAYFIKNAQLTIRVEVLGAINNAFWQISSEYKKGNHYTAVEILGEQKTKIYKLIKDKNISQEAKEQLFNEFKERCYFIFRT